MRTVQSRVPIPTEPFLCDARIGASVQQTVSCQEEGDTTVHIGRRPRLPSSACISQGQFLSLSGSTLSQHHKNKKPRGAAWGTMLALCRRNKVRCLKCVESGPAITNLFATKILYSRAPARGRSRSLFKTARPRLRWHARNRCPLSEPYKHSGKVSYKTIFILS